MQVTKPVRKQKYLEDKTETQSFPLSRCAVACTLDLVGDKWSLLVVRDLLRGSATYNKLQHSFEGIPTNILADRLKKLEEARIIVKSAYQEHPVRYSYQLTKKGRALGDVLLALVRWGKTHIPGTQVMGSPTLNRQKTQTDPGR
jgi:DNA-binding HxlR family transcriptional regulator